MAEEEGRKTQGWIVILSGSCIKERERKAGVYPHDFLQTFLMATNADT